MFYDEAEVRHFWQEYHKTIWVTEIAESETADKEGTAVNIHVLLLIQKSL